MQTLTLGLIGGGNMTRSIVSGLVQSGHPAPLIYVSDHHPDKLHALTRNFGVQSAQSNDQIVQLCDVIILSVKPQVMADVLLPLKQAILKKMPLILSVAAGITVPSYESWLSDSCQIVRVMPNTPSLVRQGASGLFANAATTLANCQIAETICQSIGLAVWVQNEDLLEIVTALSGCGPAYYFLFTELLTDIATQMGLPSDTAHKLAIQTLQGAACMASKSQVPLSTLRQQVASPGGATQQALNSLQDNNLRSVLQHAMAAAIQRSKELAKML